MSAYILLIFGMALIFIEFFLPGAIIGSIGTVLVIASIYFFASETSSTYSLVGYIGAVCIALFYLIKVAIWRMQKTAPKQTICADASQEGFVASSYDASAIGKRGVVIADLKPGGYILLDDKKLQAISASGYIGQGEQVEVISGQEESLIVKQIHKETV